MNDTAIYIHIPFCDHKCIYCDFYSIINYENVANYLSSLKTEIEYYSKKFSNEQKIISIFFGGGTPSFMDPEYIQEILETVKDNFSVTNNAEITLETNPGTVDKNKLLSFKNSGINRVSIGIQSFNDDELKFLTRIHNSKIAVDTVNDAYKSGFENISIDLIFNLPNQSKKKWLTNLEQAVKLPINHISAYSLILEPGTILNKIVIDGKVKMQSDDYDADLYEITIDYLTKNGFEQYEVSSFAKEGFQCVHNNAYWSYKNYFGFGTSAHSFIDGRRWWNFSSVKFYNESIIQKQNAVIGEEILSTKQMIDEYVMLALRSSGLNLQKFEKRFGNSWFNRNKSVIETLFDQKMIFKKNNSFILSPKGYAVCDEILTKLKA